jgi:membrane protease YdiL (CAAX protease family)
VNTIPENPGDRPETQPELAPANPAAEPAPAPGLPIEQVELAPRDPVWSGLDVFRLLLIAIVILFGAVFATLAFVPGATFRARASRLSTIPELLIVAQMLAYVVIFGYMYILITRERRSRRFWKSIHWNWPANIWPFVAMGLGLQIGFLLLGRFLPLPKETPFDALLRRPATIILIAVFAVTLGPFLEELFFRGFLYPVLARRFGMGTGIVATAFGFGLMHAAQYGYSWASVFLIFLVGVVLGVVRARKNSVAAGFLVHAAYNGTIILMLLIATDGFRHLEKLSSQ